MKKKATIFLVLSASALTVSSIGMTAFAAGTFSWDPPYTSSPTTYYRGHSSTPITTDNKPTTYMNSNYIHTTVGTGGATTLWMLVAINDSNTSRFMNAETKYYNKLTGSYDYNYTNSSTGNTGVHGNKTASSNIPTASISSQYEFHYYSYISGSSSQYSPIIEDVLATEALS
jgi:hypothetical protein